jgi:hypothetical protein
MPIPSVSSTGTSVTFDPRRKAIQVVSIGIVLAVLAGPQVAGAEKAPLPPDASYRNVLVIFLARSFDIRRYFETELVNALAQRGTTAVRSTSMMDSRVPMVPGTFLAMVEETGADAVLVTQPVQLKTKATMVDMNPQSTYNIRPTWYFNVWSVELTEYVEPQGLNLEHDLSLATQLYSVQSKEAVWAMESSSNILVAFDQGPDYSIFVKEAAAIVKQLRRSRMIAR